MSCYTATRLTLLSFSVSGNKTSEFMSGRRTRGDCGVDGYKYGTVLSSAVSGADTIVTLTSTSDTLTTNLTCVSYGIIGKGSNQSLPEHVHLGNEGDGSLLSQYRQDTNGKTGWDEEIYDKIDVVFDNSTRTLSVSSTTADSFSFWVKDIEYTKNNVDSVQISAAEGLHYIYYDNTGTLVSSQTIWDISENNKALVAYVYWDNDNNKQIFLGKELHHWAMDSETHAYLHETRGTVWQQGLGLGNIQADQSGDEDAHAQFSVGSGVIWDEDLQINISDFNIGDNWPVYYKQGATGVWRLNDTTTFPVLSASGGVNGNLVYNQFSGGSWSLTEVSQADYVLCHIFATNDKDRPIISIIGQNLYTIIFDVEDSALTELRNLETAGLPFVEFVPLATLIYQTWTAYDNQVQARIISTESDDDYIDWRGTRQGVGNISVSDHGQLVGINDDDHTQYTLVDGTRAFTGQITTQNIISDGDLTRSIGTSANRYKEGYFQTVYTSGGSIWVGSNKIDREAIGEYRALPMNYLTGLTLSNNGSDADHDIDIAIGECRDIDDSENIKLTSSITKRIDASWASGSGNGGLFSGSVIAGTTYHVFLIKNVSAGAVDAGFDTDVNAANRPGSYTKYRRIGSIITDGSANIISFHQYGDNFYLDVQVQDVDDSNPGTSAVTSNLTVPSGIQVEANILVKIVDYSVAGGTYWWISSLDMTDTVPSLNGPMTLQTTRRITPAYDYNRAEDSLNVPTNTSGQIRYRTSDSTADHRIWIYTNGWKDRRDRL